MDIRLGEDIHGQVLDNKKSGKSHPVACEAR